MRTLAKHLSRQIPTDRIALFPWPRATPSDYQVAVEVTGCSGQTEGQSSLVAQWSIFNGEGKEALVSHKSRFTASAGTQAYGAMVAAMSQTIADLSREIAAALRTLATQLATR